MFRSILARRAARVWLCIKRSVVPGAAFAFLYMFAYTVYSAIAKGGDGLSWFDLFNNMITAFVVSVAGHTLYRLGDFKGKSFHRYDEGLIGTAFTGLKRSSMMFEEGLDLFHKNDFRRALEVFTDLENGEFKLTDEETGVNEFYRGRCYHIMNAFPNAIICYEKPFPKMKGKIKVFPYNHSEWRDLQ